MLSDDGDFLRRYHTERGDEEISITSWHAHPGIGEVREVKFLTHTKVTGSPMLISTVPSKPCGIQQITTIGILWTL